MTHGTTYVGGSICFLGSDFEEIPKLDLSIADVPTNKNVSTAGVH
jgi:hypothetical protein